MQGNNEHSSPEGDSMKRADPSLCRAVRELHAAMDLLVRNYGAVG